MKFKNNVKTHSYVYHIEKVIDDTLLIGGSEGLLQLINQSDLTIQTDLLLEGVGGIF